MSGIAEERAAFEQLAVYLRNDRDECGKESGSVEGAERAVATLPSYAEARRVRQWYRDSGHDCVIRYLGDVGGGD